MLGKTRQLLKKNLTFFYICSECNSPVLDWFIILNCYCGSCILEQKRVKRAQIFFPAGTSTAEKTPSIHFQLLCKGNLTELESSARPFFEEPVVSFILSRALFISRQSFQYCLLAGSRIFSDVVLENFCQFAGTAISVLHFPGLFCGRTLCCSDLSLAVKRQSYQLLNQYCSSGCTYQWSQVIALYHDCDYSYLNTSPEFLSN